MKVKDGMCQFAYSMDGKKYNDAGKPFKMKEGRWIGAKIGYVSICQDRKKNRGWVDADWFRITK